MTEPTPPRRPLATFLRASSEDAPRPAPDATPAPEAHTVPVPDPVVADRPAAPAITEPLAGSELHATDTAPSVAQESENDAVDAAATAAFDTPTASAAPSFLRLPGARLRTPRWQWGLVSGLVVVLLLQIAVADRARLAADAGSRPWIAGLCSVLRCTLPAWQEPAAISMISRDVRPVPGQPGALQVQASFRNDARWAQGWPSLRLSLSDADGRVIGSSVFAPRDYLDAATTAQSVLEPGQSAQIAFRVREPAAATVAFTFEFL